MSINKPRLTQYPRAPITISDGDEYPIERGGTFIRLRRASGPLRIRIDNDQELLLEENDVLRFKDERFNGLIIINDSGVDVTFQLEIGEGTVETNNVSISGELAIAKANGRNHKAVTVGTSAVELLAASTTRKGWKVYNNGTVPIYLGSDNTVTTANGDPVPVGGAAGWTDRDALYAISGSAGQDVRVTEIL